jgi:hypothetical protein
MAAKIASAAHNHLTGEGGGGVISNDSEKAWSSIYYSILSACMGPIPVYAFLKKISIIVFDFCIVFNHLKH